MAEKDTKKINNSNKWLPAAAAMITIAAALYILAHLFDPVLTPIIEVSQPFLIAVAIAFLLDPIVDLLQKRKIPRATSVAIVGISFLVVFTLVGFIVVPNLVRQSTELANHSGEYAQLAQNKIDLLITNHQSLLKRFNLPTDPDELSEQISTKTQAIAKNYLSKIADSLAGVFGRLLWIIIIPLSTLWILKDLDYFKHKIVHLTPPQHQRKLEKLGSAVGAVFGRYVRGMLTVALIFSFVSSIMLSIFGLNYALVFGVLSGLFYLVPYVGVAALAIAVIITALVQSGGEMSYSLLLGGYIFVQSFIIFDLLITPRIVGKSVGVHPVLTLFALSLGAKFFGVAGMILAVPTVAAIQVAIGQFYPQIYIAANKSK